MRTLFTAFLASIAVIAFSSSAIAMGGCGFGHTKQVTASVEDEATIMSTHDGAMKLPSSVADTDEAAVVSVPSEDETETE